MVQQPFIKVAYSISTVFAIAGFKVCNDPEAGIAQSVQYLGCSNRSFSFSKAS
jgi:hypothetical protein